MNRYAENTSVSVERSLAEIDALLCRYGATDFGFIRGQESCAIGCICNGRRLRFSLPLPDRNDKRFWETPAKGKKRTPDQAYAEWEQACRSSWRSLALAVKAKLETVRSGISTFESEFLAHIVDPATNRTVAETIIPMLAESYDKSAKRRPLALTLEEPTK